MEQTPLIEYGLPAVLAVIMVGIGLSLTKEDFREQARSPLASVIGLVGQLILVPIVGVGTALLFGGTENTEVQALLVLGLVLVAVSPGGATSNLITYLARGNVALSIILTAIASVAVILSLPLWFDIGARIIPGAPEQDVSVPLLNTLGLLFVVILIPVLIGMVMRAKKPVLSDKIERFVGIIGAVVLVILIVGILLGERENVVDYLRAIGPAVVFLNIAFIVLGGLLAWIFRLGKAEQIAIATEFSIKNTTLSLLIALTVIGGTAGGQIAIAAAVYSIVMYVTMFPIIWVGRRMMAGENVTVVEREAAARDGEGHSEQVG